MPNTASKRFDDVPSRWTPIVTIESCFLAVVKPKATYGVHRLSRAFAAAFVTDTRVFHSIRGDGYERPELGAWARGLSLGDGLSLLES